MASEGKNIEGEIRPSRALYIKLGDEGRWEEECIYGTQTLRFGYHGTSHEDCVARRWTEVEKQLRTNLGRTDKGAITRGHTQIQNFYEAGRDVLWVTFHGNYLWWCFSEPTVTLTSDGSKTRKVIDKWSNTDNRGNDLSMDKLRGTLLSMQAFRGTICSVKESDYLVSKINGKTPRRIVESQAAYGSLTEIIAQLIRGLRWKDFELLVDLIFREAGWKRLGPIGKTQKSIDLELLSPVANEKISVQVKSKAGLQDYQDYRKKFADMGYAKFFFVVHSPDESLAKEITDQKSDRSEMRLLGPREVAKLSVDYGLCEWIMTKAE